MKLIRIRFQNQIRWAAVEDQHHCRLIQMPPSVPQETAASVLELSPELLPEPLPTQRLPTLNNLRYDPLHGPLPLDAVQILAPVQGMEKIICIGTNYAEHAREMGGEPPTIPVVFSKFPSAIVGPLEPVVHPEICTKLDFEAELVVVLGKTGRQIPRNSAMDHVFGYCCGNDISARDWQKEKPGGQWLLGKTFDSFAPLGPMLVTRDEIADPHKLAIQFRLNGEIMQDSNTNQLIFPIDVLISHLSQFFTLKPGDLIFTGTPPGVGAGRKPPRFLQAGDEMEVEIEGLGVLRNQVTAASR